MFFPKFKIPLLTTLFITTALVTGCYKKDLEEFKKVNSWTYAPELALPFVEEVITLGDTIPKPPAFTIVTMSDTATIELPKDKDTLESIIERLDFKIRLTNTFPFDGDVQVYFADTNNVFQDSLLSATERVVLSGSLANPTVKDIQISIDKDRYINLTKNDQMYFYYKLTTNDITGIENDYLKINMGLKAKLSVPLDGKK